jgi:hypothetical protein
MDNKKVKFLINFKKIFIVYTAGFVISYSLPNKYFFSVMNYYHNRINQRLEIIEKDDYFKIY